MKRQNLFLILTLILLASLLSACGGSSGLASSWPGIAANQETAYLAYNQHIYAIDINNGNEIWRFPEKAQNTIAFYAAPVLGDGQLLAPSYDYNLYSLDIETGVQNWVFDGSSNRLIASPLVTADGIYQPSADGNLYALTLDGDLHWTFRTGGALWATPSTNETCDCIYLSSMDHHVYAIEAQTGEQLWQSPSMGGAMVGTPAYSSDGFVYIGTFGGELLALNAENGQIVWRIQTDGWVWAGPALAEGVLYFGDLDGNFYALEASTGEQIWPLQPDGSIVGTPLITENGIYFATEAGTIYLVNSAGETLDNMTVTGTLYSSPVISGETVLVGSINSETPLVALNANGVQQWAFTPQK